MASFRAIQLQVNDNRRASDYIASEGALPSTGDKTVTFLNTGGYFMNLSPQGGAGFGMSHTTSFRRAGGERSGAVVRRNGPLILFRALFLLPE